MPAMAIVQVMKVLVMLSYFNFLIYRIIQTF